MDDTLYSLIFHHVTKFVGGLLLAYIGWLWLNKSLLPWWKEKEVEGATTPTTPREFPFATMLLMIALSCSYVYYVTMEQAYRSTSTIHSDFAEEEAEKLDEMLENYEPPAPEVPGPTLEERIAVEEQRVKEQNEAAKQAFKELAEPESDESSPE